jgi:DNA invertase Pin-like site-specific DNA recombinase
MPKIPLAIATCRVSSFEQLDSNSLNRQAQSVAEAAKFLGVTIPSDGIWSGNISSKEGRNYSRRDLRAMLDYCKKHPNVKYLIVDEIDRFMRSIDEMFYFEVEFRNKVGVKVWYAGDPALNSDDPMTKLRRAMEAFKAEGSNLERQIKSIKGQTAAIKDGRWPFSIKPGYKRGYEKGVQEVHDVRGKALKKILLRIEARIVTPTQGLIEFNKSAFMENGHSLYKMDKFRKIVTDPFYASILEMNKQVQIKNENGLHEPLITKEQHYHLVQIMNDKKKNQIGPRKNGNPKYPISNLLNCGPCAGKKNSRFVGFDHGNGKPNSRLYEKYRCRSCKKILTRKYIHANIEQVLGSRTITQNGLSEFVKALNTVWKEREGQAVQDTIRIEQKIKRVNQSITNQVEAATDPDNASIKEEILASITKKKAEVINLEEELEQIAGYADNDKDRFLRFAFDFVDTIGSRFLDPDLSKENRLRCKLILFPAGFCLSAENKVYTPQISPIYGLAATKKDLPKLEKSLLVRVRRL